MVPSETRSLGWNPLSVLGPMARTVPDLCLLLSCMAEHDGRDPLSFPGSRPPALPATIDLAGLRVAITPDFGFAPVEHGIAATFAAVIARLRPVFARADDASPDCAGTDEVFEVLRATGALAAHGDRVRATPDQVGPNIHRDVERGLAACAADVAQAMKQQTVLYRRWQRFFDEYDIILSPAVAISPRPWTELFPAEINGAPTRTYFHWLALAYAVTVVGHPAMSLPVGLDQAGMPFGLQIVGPRHGDAAVLAIGAALERLLANDPLTARPRPDLAMLQAAPPIAKAPGFMGFGAA